MRNFPTLVSKLSRDKDAGVFIPSENLAANVITHIKLTMKQTLLITAIFFLIEPVFAQTNKFGAITKEQWEIKKFNLDTTANFLYLFDVGDISVSGKEIDNKSDKDCKLKIDYFSLSYERHFRVKVLKSDEINPVILSLLLRSKEGKKDRLISFKGVLVRNENGKEMKSKFNSKSLTQKVNEDGSCIMSFELPMIKKESIVDIDYIIETNILSETPEWSFSYDFPCLYSEINMSIPDFVECQKINVMLNKLAYDSYIKRISYSVIFFNYPDPSGNSAGYNYNEIHEKYSLSNVLPTPKLMENRNLKYVFTNFNFNSVSCNKKEIRFTK